MSEGYEAYVDTDVIIRLLANDDPHKHADAKALFERVERGDLSVLAPVTVIADAVYVLASQRLYRLPRTEVSELLVALVQTPHFRVSNRDLVLEALAIYGSNPIDFGDAFLAASMQQDGPVDIFSYDHDFDRFSNLRRHDPGASW